MLFGRMYSTDYSFLMCNNHFDQTYINIPGNEWAISMKPSIFSSMTYRVWLAGSMSGVLLPEFVFVTSYPIFSWLISLKYNSCFTVCIPPRYGIAITHMEHIAQLELIGNWLGLLQIFSFFFLSKWKMYSVVSNVCFRENWKKCIIEQKLKLNNNN